MKYLLVYIFCLLTIGLINAQTWIWSTDMPKAGEMVNVDVKSLDVTGDFHIVAYSMQGKDLMANDVNYQVDRDGIHISLPVPAQTNWIRVVIKDDDNQAVAGDQKEIIKEGAPVKSSLIEKAIATSSYYRPMGLKRDEAGSTTMFREAVKSNPKWMEMPEALRGYYNVSKASKSTEDLDQIKTYLLSFNTNKDVGSPDLLIAALRISKDIGDTVLYQSLRKQLDLSSPQSLIGQEELLATYNKAASLDEKIVMRDQFKSAYIINDQNRNIWDQMTASLVEQSASNQDWKHVESYINEIMDPMYKASQCNEYGWTLVGEGIDKDAIDLDAAARLSSSSLQYLTPDLKKPGTLSKNEWEKNLDFIRAQYGDTYALILYKQGKYNEAVDHQAFAVKTSKYNDIEMNDRYVIYLEKAGQKEDLLSFVDGMIEIGKASEKMKETHKQIWMSERTPDQLYNQYVSKLEAKAKEKRLEEIKAMWMDAPSVSFTLKDLDGKEVSLSDFKGKTVVVDFWATWCGPCKASFPGMKNVVEHYALDKDVVFLFVDTWENGENIPAKAGKFIADNNYPFHVLSDSQNQVVTNYKVDGIPTKFIIDKDQKIRFKAVGYSGSTESLVEELMTMIEMTQNGGKLQKT